MIISRWGPVLASNNESDKSVHILKNEDSLKINLVMAKMTTKMKTTSIMKKTTKMKTTSKNEDNLRNEDKHKKRNQPNL